MWITQCMIVENVENVNNVDKYIFLTTLIHRSSNITFSAFWDKTKLVHTTYSTTATAAVNIYRHAGESVWIRVTIVNKRGGLDICA